MNSFHPAAILAQAADVSPLDYPGPAWSPYLVGFLIGVLSWFTLLLSKDTLGASSSYATISGMLGKVFAKKHTLSLAYFQDNPPRISWGFMLFIGIFAGAFLAAATGNELTGRWLPPMWEARFGADSHLLRTGIAIAGGLLMAVGARLAGGCTSGHGISGTMQLSIGSWISAAGFFIGGIFVAMLLYRI
ncbi:MAG: YeeE/YedE thiosulfate transporter family protein [Verrucomicrobiales bacterium]|nr:YeeE/YedE thiosulfate transporter family protein [Verrucomicrobiales bacterium]